jgi:AraC-like DNA-binding protein
MPVPSPDPFSTIHGVDAETRSHAGYFLDNRLRGSSQLAAVQQTLAGAGFFDDAAGRRLVPAGQAMLFTHDEASAYGYPPEVTEPYRLRFVSFNLAGLQTWFDRLRAEFGAVVRMPIDGESASVLNEIMRCFRARAFRDRFQETELLHQLLVSLYREQIAASQAGDPIERGYHHLRDKFRSPLNLKSVADLCGVSREHFIRTFGRRYDEPPGEMLRRLRLEHADRMLKATQMPVQEVALASGFADANSFCRAYRRRFGDTPGQSRRS